MDTINERIFKEITIKKSNKKKQQLGISLDSHSHPSFGTFIFISKIEKGSIANKNNNLLVGDQILKVNGKAVHCLKDIETQLANSSSADKVVFFVARINTDIDEIDLNLIESNGLAPIVESSENSGVEKDSGISRTTDSEQDMHFRGRASDKIVPPMNSKHINSSLEHELAVLRMEMETIRLECDRLLNKESASQSKQQIKQSQTTASSLPWRQSVPMHQAYNQQNTYQKNQYQHQPVRHVALEYTMPHTPSQTLPRLQEETSSAYNSGGDSCRSTPLIGITVTPPDGYQYRTAQPPTSTETVFASVRQPFFKPALESSRPPLMGNSYKLGQTCYTSKDKLAETLAHQQNAIQKMVKNSSFERIPAPAPTPAPRPLPKIQIEPQKSEEEANEYTWKLKRRPDGSCYITKKPVKQQILKAREEQLNRERTGLSTDDDAASELKSGRFWSREERKKQLEKAREKKASKIQKQKNVTVKDQMLLQLSNRKQMRISGKQVFDKFTTLQEFLTHGSRDPSAAPIGGILSVTTV